MLHVTDTDTHRPTPCTHHRIYSVTVVMPRPHVKIRQRDLKGESQKKGLRDMSHLSLLKEGAEGREPFGFEGGVREPC